MSDPNRRASATSTPVRKALLLAGGLLAGLLLAELACRLVLGPHEESPVTNLATWRVEGLVADPELGYAFEPGYAGRMVLANEYDVPFRINGQGLRDERDFAREHEGVTRVLLVGDSFVFGVGVAFEDTLGEQLERALEAAPRGGAPVEVVGVGVPGYGPDDYALLAERWVPRLRPDVVVACFFTGNDIVDCERRHSATMAVVEGHLVSRRKAWTYGLRKHSVLANLVLRRFNPYRDVEPGRPKVPTPADVEKICRSLRPWLARLAAVAGGDGPQVVAAVLYGRDFLASLRRNEVGYAIKGLREMLADLRRLQVPVLDPLEAWRAAGLPLESHFFPLDAHHTAEGNRFVAGWLASSLVEHLPESFGAERGAGY